MLYGRQAIGVTLPDSPPEATSHLNRRFVWSIFAPVVVLLL